MIPREQLEALASDTASKLAERIGSGAQVILMVADLNDQTAPYMIERFGSPLGITWLLRVGSRIIEDQILPKPTINRNG